MAESQVAEAIRLCFDNWTAMNLALDHGWGDPSNKEAFMAQLTDTIVHYQVEEEDIEDLLDEFMEEKFSVILEDDSARELARIFLAVYNQSRSGDSIELDRLRRLKKSSVEECKKINEVEEVTHMMQNAEIEPPELVPTVDEDGFELVQSRRKKK
ncbi:unnamed protein product [Blepharisma stoltei]|uniref:Pre-rRNA-processing protein TSR2 homolog n=1 Tax=Blepharisma stoltei TaxID=1481888 RepID=A0AAU9IC99_9CILI|nr:unnamed protein product [Blepharisma stoltei]